MVISIHFKTIACLDRAEQLINSGKDEALPYASLELRMAIEAWFYDIRQQYLSHLPGSLHETWQPHKLMNAILKIDSGSLSEKYLLVSNAEDGPEFQLRLQARSLTPKELKKHHNSLGVYLHAPLDGKPHDRNEWRDRLRTIAKCLDRLRDATVMFTGFRWTHFPCECGLQIKRETSSLKDGDAIECSDENCQRHYRVSAVGDGHAATPVRVSTVCQMCGESFEFNAGFLREAATVACKHCHGEFIVRPAFMLARRESA